MTRPERAELHNDLILGRRQLSEMFRCALPRTLATGLSPVTAACSNEAIYQLQAGWAYQFRDFSDGRRAIVDVYLPGDVIGLDSVLRTRSLQEVIALNSVTIAAIDAEGALTSLMACRPTALYITWLLGQRQRRADRLLAAISSLDARGRMAMMVLDFYTRLRRQRLITGLMYNIPLSQTQIGSYLGLTAVYVNRMVRCLRDERVVNLERHSVTILDLERLKILAQNGEMLPSTGTSGGRVPTEPASSVSQVTVMEVDSDRAGLRSAPKPGLQSYLSSPGGSYVMK